MQTLPPKLTKRERDELLAQQNDLAEQFERWYGKMKRAFNRLESLRAKMKRIAKRVAKG